MQKLKQRTKYVEIIPEAKDFGDSLSKNMKYLQLNQKAQHGHATIICEKGTEGCKGCYFLHDFVLNGKCKHMKSCMGRNRADKESVIYRTYYEKM